VGKAVDESGRSLKFFNTTPTGGFGAAYTDTGEPRESHVCFINGVQCRADEAYFGGVVVRPAAAKGAAHGA